MKHLYYLFLIVFALPSFSQVNVTVDPNTTFQTQKYWIADPGLFGPGPSCAGVLPCNPDWNSLIEAAHMSKLVNETGVNTSVTIQHIVDWESGTNYFACGVLGNTCPHNYYASIPPTKDGADTSHIRCNGTDYTFAQALTTLWKSGATCAEWQFGSNDYFMDNYYMGANGFRQAVLNAGRTPHLLINLNENLLDFTVDSRTGTAPAEFAKAVTAFYIHDQNKYGVTVDLLDIINEPDLHCNSAIQTSNCQNNLGAGWWNTASLGATVNAVLTNLSALGFTPQLGCCAVTNSTNAVPWYSGVKTVTGAGKINVLTYHTYTDTLAAEQAIATQVGSDGIVATETEYSSLSIDNNVHNILFQLLNGNSSGVKRAADANYGPTGNSISLLTITSETSYTVGSGNPYASQYTIGNESGGPTNGPAWFFPQLWGYVPEGSIREKTTTSGPFGSAAVAYKAPDATHRVVMITGATTAQAFNVTGLPAGTYGCTYTTNTSSAFKQSCGANQTIGNGGTVSYTLTGVAQALGTTTIAATIFSISSGAVLTPGTWANSNFSGYPFSIVGFDGAAWVSSRNTGCVQSEMPPGSFSEQQNAIHCYSYPENRVTPLMVSGNFHSAQTPSQGHADQDFVYDSDLDSLIYVVDNSFANTPQNYLGLWQFDVAGLLGIDRPLQKVGGAYTRFNFGNSAGFNAFVYDSTNKLLTNYPDYTLIQGHASICNLATGTCVASTTTNAPPVGVQATMATAFNSTNGLSYWYSDVDGSWHTFNAATGTWAAITLACSGVDCSGGLPPIRKGAGVAYSSVDNKLLLVGGFSATTIFTDTWVIDPVGLTITEACSSCGYPQQGQTQNRPGNRLVFDATDNAFIYFPTPGTIWLYAISGTSGTVLNYGRTVTNYAPTTGSLNKTVPPSSPGVSTNQGWAIDASISISGSTIYVSHNETTPNTDANSNCWTLVPYILQGGAYIPTGTVDTGCAAIGNGSNIRPTGHSAVANVNGTVWATWDIANLAGGSSATSTFAGRYSGGTGGTYTNSAVGCFYASCAGNTNITSSPAGIIAVGTTPTIASIEENKSQFFVREDYLFVSQWNGSTWAALGSMVNGVTHGAGTGVYVTSASLATDGTNPASCWAERIDGPSNRYSLVTTPQIQCARWNGSAWVRMGSTSLNQAATSWAYTPSMVYYNGVYYVSWTEQTQLGNTNLYVKSYNLGANTWSLVGPGSLNINTSTGNAFHSSLTTNGTTLFVGASEQSSVGQHAKGFIKSSTGGSWTTVATNIVADATNGSVSNFNIVATAGTVTAVWIEAKYGNLPQVYSQAISIVPVLSIPLTVQETLISGTNGFAGLTRTNDPITVGVPIPDSIGLVSLSNLGLTGASAAQFSTEATWPSGNIKWLKVRAIVPSVTGGTTNVGLLTLTNSGSGNFGGANLATDNGATITVSTNGGTCGAGSAICATVKKANFNFIDQMTIGATTVVSSGASTGLVLTGPPASGVYPANVTCSPTAGGTACTTPFTSANDTTSTCSIEENGPAVAVLKCVSDLNDGASHVYMHQTTRLYFYKGRSQVKYTVIGPRNADYGTSDTFASASKGFNAFEVRVNPNISGTLTYTIGNHTGTPTSGTMAGTDTTYLYQAESNLVKPTAWCNSVCGMPSSISGYAIMNNGSALQTGTASQYVPGWADIHDASGVGVMIGQDQLAGYGNKSLEFRAGGSDVRLGLWAGENNTTSPSTITPNAPYYQAWPQWSIHNGWMEFHTTALASPQNNHLMLEYPLLARADPTWYNTAGVFPNPLLDKTEESNYYTSILGTNASPSVPAVAALDDVMGSTANANQTCNARGSGAIPTVCVFKYWAWAVPGGANQMEFHLSGLYNFIRRGFTGEYAKANYFYKYVAENAFPMSDGFKWTSHSAETQYYGYPTATSRNYNLSIAGSGGQAGLNIEQDFEHANAQGYDTFYLMGGDETIKDSLMEAVPPFFANTTSVNNYTGVSAGLWNDRSAGNLFKWAAHLYTFLNSVGDASDASSILTNAQTVYGARLQPDLCAFANFPAGCTPDVTDNIPQTGSSKVRGVSNVFKDTSLTVTGPCTGGITTSPRTAKPFMSSRKLEGMEEFYNIVPSSWPFRVQFFDYMYGTTQWAFGEMLTDDGTNSWTNNSLRYAQGMDYANNCNTADWAQLGNVETVWYHWTTQAQYLGILSPSQTRLFNQMLQRDSSNGNIDEFYHDTIGTAIYYILHPPATISLQTLPITSFSNNGGGSYTLGWTTPAGASNLRGKWGTNQLVDWIGFNAGTYAFDASKGYGGGTGSPATQQNWFASTEIAMPIPATGPQTVTVTGLPSPSLTQSNFMIKSMSTSPLLPVITTTSPLPNAILNSAYSTTLAATNGPITWSIFSGTLPAGLSLAPSTGIISGTPTGSGSTFTITATNAFGSASSPFTINVVSAPTITTASPLPNGQLAVAYSVQLAATGTTPITWTLTSGTLPNGLNLSSGGLISGTPGVIGTSTFGITATNSVGNNSKTFSLTINPAPGATTYYVALTGSDLNNGTSPATPFATLTKLMSVMAPGDTGLLHYGDTFNLVSSVTLPNSGTSPAHSRLGAYGNAALPNPALNGTVVETGWVLDSGAIYKKTPLGLANQVFQDGIRLIKAVSKVAMVAGSFFYDSGTTTLYVWTTNSTNPSTHTIQDDLVGSLINFNGKAFWDVDHVDTFGSSNNGYDFQQVTGAHDITVTNATSSFNVVRGFSLGGYTALGTSNIAFSNCVGHDNLSEAFWIGNGTNNGCTNCEAYNNGKDVANGYSGGNGNGIIIGIGGVNNYILKSYVHDTFFGFPIMDEDENHAGRVKPTGSLIEYNYILNNTATLTAAAELEGASGTFAYNWIVTTASGAGKSIRMHSQGGVATGATNYVAVGNSIYQGVAAASTTFNPEATTSNFTFENNKVIFATVGGSAGDAISWANGATGISDYNSFQNTEFFWGATSSFPATLAAWKTACSCDAHSIVGSAAGYTSTVAPFNLALTTGAPEIDAGLNLGSSLQFGLDPNSVWPNGVLTQNQNSFGTGWEIGSVVYTTAPVPPVITTLSPLPPGVINSPYSVTLQASGSTPITWALIAGTLPVGFSLNTSTGAITGSTAVANSYGFTISATNVAGSTSQAYTLLISSSVGVTIQGIVNISGNTVIH